jgi:hypothetical protein
MLQLTMTLENMKLSKVKHGFMEHQNNIYLYVDMYMC